MVRPSRDTAAVRVARALADPTRFRLLRAIAARAEISCQELTALFPVSQATVSHHLKVLSEAGLVTVRNDGTFHRYRVFLGALERYARDVAALARPLRRRRPPSLRSLALRPGGDPAPAHRSSPKQPRKEQST